MDNKSILSATVSPIEPSDDDLTQYEVSERSVVSYEMSELKDHIGTSEFKSLWMNFINEIRFQELNIQKDFCRDILSRMQEKYNFIFPEKVNISNKEEVEHIYKFIEFIEFDCIKFLVDIWFSLHVNFDKIDFEEYLTTNYEQVVKQIDSMLDTFNLLELTLNLIMTIESKRLISLLKDMTLRNREIISHELRIRNLQ